MHEFSLAQNIVEIVRNSATKAEKEKVYQIILEIGELSGVEEEALLTALGSQMTDSLFKDSIIKIENRKGIAICKECKTEFGLSNMFTLCPNCNGYYKDIISGKEFNVLSIEAE